MYSVHQPLIANWVAEDSKRLHWVILMASLSIQQPWITVGDQLEDVRKLGVASKHIWGMKVDTYNWLMNENDISSKLYRTLKKAIDSGRVDRAHWLLLRIPGIGLAKGGFILQMLFGHSGCIDSVNQARFGVPKSKFRLSKTVKTVTMTRHIRKYLAFIEEVGGTGRLWDDWCHTQAMSDASFEDAEDVSRRHCQYLGVL